MLARRWGVGSLGAVAGTRPRYQAPISTPSGAVALLELLAAATPARIVAPDLVLLVDDALLYHGHLLLGVVEVGHFGPAHGATGGRGGGCQRARADRAASARVGHAACACRAARGGEGFPRSAAVVALDVDLHVEDHSRVVAPDAVHEVAEEGEGLVLIGHERVDLSKAAQVDALAQVVHVEEVLAPAFVDDLQQQEALERTHELLAERLCASVVALHRHGADAVDQVDPVDALAVEVVLAEVEREELPQRREQAVEVPIVHEVAGRVLLDRSLDHAEHLLARLLADALSLEHLVAVGVDDAALLVHDIVVLEHAFSDQEVLFLDLLLRFLDLLGEDACLDRLLVALLVDAAEAVEDPVDAVSREQPHEVVLGREEEAALAGIALAAGTPAQLVVDAP